MDINTIGEERGIKEGFASFPILFCEERII